MHHGTILRFILPSLLFCTLVGPGVSSSGTVSSGHGAASAQLALFGLDNGITRSTLTTQDPLSHARALLPSATARRATDGPTRTRLISGTEGQPTEVVEQNWDAGLGDWVNGRRTTYIYNPSGTAIEILTAYWLANAWVQNYRNRYVYDQDGYLVEEYEDDWSGADWVAANMIAYVNNLAGKPVTAHQKMWTGTVWADLYRWSYSYNGAGSIIEELAERWLASAWVNYLRLLSTYDGNNNLSTFTFESWDGAAWAGVIRAMLTYNLSNWPALILVQTWDGAEWADDSRNTITYDTEGRPTEEVSELWNGASWTNDLRHVKTYDAGGNLTEDLAETWTTDHWEKFQAVRFTFVGLGAQPATTPAGTSGVSAADVLEAVTLIWFDSAWVNFGRISYSYEPATAVEYSGGKPDGYRLEEGYPNPFNPSTTISFSIPERSFVRMTIHDVMGREVARLVQGDLPAGEHTLTWDAAGMPTGAYHVRMQAGGFSETRKLVLMR
jgi:hypothetical protein